MAPDLSRCTALAATSLHGELTAYAARRCMAAGFAEVAVLTDLELDVPTIPIPPLTNIRDYNVLMTRGLVEHVGTPFVLVFQWDGFVLDPGAWTDAFFDYDYIGAPWEEGSAPPGQRVGNGGFSLRSRRLLEALQDPELDYDPGWSEDKTICRRLRSVLERNHGIRFAPVELARRFSFEFQIPEQPTFGFHGHFNLPLAMPEADLWWALERIPERMWSEGVVRRWVIRARKRGRPELAARLERRCRDAFPQHTADWPTEGA